MTINYFEAMRYVYSIIAGLFLFPCLSCSTDTAEWLDEENDRCCSCKRDETGME